MEVLNCLVEVYISGTFCWVRIFGSHVDVINRGHHILKVMNLYPSEVVYTKQGLLIPTKIIDGEYKCVPFNIYFSISFHIRKSSLYM